MSKIMFMFNDAEIDWTAFRTIIKQSPIYKDLEDRCIAELMRPSDAVNLGSDSFNKVFNSWLFQFVVNGGLNNVSVRIDTSDEDIAEVADEPDNNTAE